MLTVEQEFTIQASEASGKSLEAFMNVFLQSWLFSAGFSISKDCEGALDVQKGTVVDANLGGLLWILQTVDRPAGLIEYTMDPKTNLGDGPVLKSCRGEINVTETDEAQHTFCVVWKVEFELDTLLVVTSLGVTRLTTKEMFRTLIRKDMERVEQGARSEKPVIKA